MNFGLALAKPGESNLGLAARLWQANLGAWRLDSVFINQRIAQEIARNHRKEFVEVDGSLNGLAAIKAFERHHFPDEPRADLPAGIGSTKSVRQCFVCAQARYHSLYFNTPWIEQCPIHNSPLLTSCPTCSKKWPEADDVHKRTCDTCGIRRKSGSPTKLELFGSDEYDAFKELDVYFSHSVNIGIPESIHLRHLSTARLDEYAKTQLYPSVLAAHYYSDQNLGTPIPEVIAPKIHTCEHKRFKFKPAEGWNVYVSDSQMKKMGQIRQKVVKAVTQKIQQLADHPIGSCEQNENDGRFECVYCDCHNQIDLAFYHHAGRNQPLADYYLRNLGKERYSDPGLFQVIKDRNSKRIFAVPPAIQWFLYELDVLSCVKRLILQLHYLKSPQEDVFNNVERPDETSLLGGHSPFTNYYYFVIEGDYCHLYYPSEYRESRFSNFENWLSITRAF